jgi:ABC-type Fe3+ transport system substrate-binding protein
MVGGDPRTKGSGFNSATVMRLKQHDDDMIKKLYVDQEMVIGTDARQLTEFMVRGRYIVGIGAVDEVILKDFVDQGMGMNLKSMPLADIDYVYANSSVAWLMKEAPHPNAAALFINWLLTKEGATIWTNNIGDNSRRVDVPPAQPDRVPVPGVEYIHLQAESFLDELQKTQDIAKSVLN